MSNLADKLRKITPLSWRRAFGPYIGFLAYFVRTRIVGKTWEPKVLSIEDTLTKLEEKRLSMIRFGDGELSLIAGSDLGFQKFDKDLAEKLTRIIKINESGLLICIPGIFGHLEKLTSVGFWFEIHHLFRYASLWRSLTFPERTYGEAFITRPYLGYRDKSGIDKIYSRIRNLWQGRQVLLIEGEKSRLGVGNDLFSKADTVRRILGPSENAFSKVEEVKNEVEKYPKDALVLISLGPAAKVLAYDLYKLGYQVLDIGHVDMEYEMFLRGSKKLVPVANKYFNEIDHRKPEDCTDPEYKSQIVARIL